MASRKFIVAELVMAICGLAILVLNIVSWRGGPEQTAALVFALLMCAAGLTAAGFGLRARRQQVVPSPDR